MLLVVVNNLPVGNEGSHGCKPGDLVNRSRIVEENSKINVREATRKLSIKYKPKFVSEFRSQL